MMQMHLVLLSVLLITALTGALLVNAATANPGESLPPSLSMPEEYLNYSITSQNETVWAKVYGKYPIQILTNPSCSLTELPMVYPTPPCTTNIKITLNGAELDWSNYTQAYPEALHHTAIGDWPMIYCVIENVSDFFLLEIQYEHPVQQVNGTYMFLYDINISPYLSLQSPNSTAYFTIELDAEVANFHVFTAESDVDWSPLGYATECSNSTTIVSAQVYSRYSEPLLGDLIFTFTVSGLREFSAALAVVAFGVVMAVAGVTVLVYFKKRRCVP